MKPEFVVGEVGFGPSFDRSADIIKAGILEDQIAALEAKNRELIRRNNRLARALERCACLSEEVANLKHQALLEHHNSL